MSIVASRCSELNQWKAHHMPKWPANGQSTCLTCYFNGPMVPTKQTNAFELVQSLNRSWNLRILHMYKTVRCRVLKCQLLDFTGEAERLPRASSVGFQPEGSAIRFLLVGRLHLQHLCFSFTTPLLPARIFSCLHMHWLVPCVRTPTCSDTHINSISANCCA